MTSLVFLLYALAHAVLFGWATALFLRRRHPATVPLLLVLASLFYGNAVLAVGGWIGHGALLERLSVPRFFLQAVAMPLLILTALAFVRRAGLAWSRTGLVGMLAGLLAAALVGAGFWTDMVGLDLAARRAGDLAYYGNAAASGPPLALMVTLLALTASALAVWRKGGGPWLLGGVLVQLAAVAAGGALVIVGNLGELVLLLALVFTDQRLPAAGISGFRTL